MDGRASDDGVGNKNITRMMSIICGSCCCLVSVYGREANAQEVRMRVWGAGRPAVHSMTAFHCAQEKRQRVEMGLLTMKIAVAAAGTDGC